MTETSVTIAQPVPADVVAASGPISRQIDALTISDTESHAIGLSLGKKLKGMKEYILGMFKEPKKQAFDLHRTMTANERKYLQPIEDLMGKLNAKLNTYEIEERRRADEEARQKQLAAQRLETERTIAEAVTAEQAGDPELAAALLDAPVVAPTVLPAPEIAKVAGASTRVVWSAQVVQLMALINYVAANPEHQGLLQPNQTALNGMARAMKENLRIPGVRAISEVSRSFRAE